LEKIVATTSGSHAWKFPTSPRSPYKLKGDLVQLRKLEGKIYNTSLQIEYAKLLSESSNFAGIAKNDPAFSGRDRLRGLRILGLVNVPESSKNEQKLRFTEAGNYFVECSDTEDEYFFERQVAKVQFRSPLHSDTNHDFMDVRPLTLIIKILMSVKSLTKDEFALFGITTVKASNVDRTINEINLYREKRKNVDSGIERKKYFETIKVKKLNEIYKTEILSGNTKLREGGGDFLKTKWQTLRDYADSSIRYLIATGLITINPRGQSIELTKARIEDAIFLLDEYGISNDKNVNLNYEDFLNNYLGSLSSLKIRKDNKQAILEDFNKIISSNSFSNNDQVSSYEKEFKKTNSTAVKLGLLSKLEIIARERNLKNQGEKIKKNLENESEDIIDVFKKIVDRKSDILDKPLMLEWNSWRAFEFINDAIEVRGNFLADSDGNPTRTAAGQRPDIIIEYESFWLVVEVTLQSGYRQYESEGNPIIRHLGTKLKEIIQAKDSRPIYGIFIAQTINPEVTSYLFSEAWRVNQVWGGAVRFLPIEINQFINFLENISKSQTFDHKVFNGLLEKIFSIENKKLGEIDWINSSIKTLESF
jgi:hypothetical protein